MSSIAICALPFLALFILSPLTQLDFMLRVPGDIGDGRLNAYFLEHVWQVFIGRADSFVHMPFYWPTLWVGAFSDLHWGSAMVYVLARMVGSDSITSYQLWWLFAYFANYIAALSAFRILRFNIAPAVLGALFFTFALPVAAHTYPHAQLSYRFGAPLALAFYIRFLLDGGAQRFLWALVFTVWQFYATIYIGFFTLVSLLFVTFGYFRFFILPWVRIKNLAQPALLSFAEGALRHRVAYWCTIVGLLIVFILAFIPYLVPSNVYGVSRDRAEIFSQLPRFLSYFYTASSDLWHMDGQIFEDIPILGEHQMFIGIAGLVMATWGAFISHQHKHAELARLLWVSPLGVILVTLNHDNMSLWVIFSDLPLASAIRAVTRIDLVLLFFVSGLIAVLAQQAQGKGLAARGLLAIGIIVAGVEATKLRTNTTSVVSIQDTINADVASARESMTDGAFLFISQNHNDDVVGEQPFYAMELRAMWVGSILGVPVINGYSGNIPTGYDFWFGQDCSEAGRRLALAYQSWPELTSRVGTLEEMLKRVHLVGFPDSCGAEQVILGSRSLPRTEPLPVSVADDIVLRVAFREASFLFVEIVNNSGNDFVPASRGKDDVNLAFRWRGTIVETGDGYTRIPLPLVVPAHGSVEIQVPLIAPNLDGSRVIEVSLVQEGQFWFHEVGMPLLEVEFP
jgi:hypothetical protein